MVGVRAGLGENLNTPEAGAVEFRRERVGIDADFTDGAFRRQLAATEAIDEELGSVGTGGGAGEGEKISLEIVRIIRQIFQIFILEDQGTDVLGGVCIHLACGVRAHLHLLSFGGDLQRHIERGNLPGCNCKGWLQERHETLGIRPD